MSKQDYLLLSRGKWDESADKDAVQGAIDRFYTWYERGVADGTFKRGSRLENRGKMVMRSSVTDGPFAETKELIGGYWFIVAGSLEEAATIAAQNPCLEFGLSYEIRPLEGERANVRTVSNETPSGWAAGEA